jgi:hypothetical protein
MTLRWKKQVEEQLKFIAENKSAYNTGDEVSWRMQDGVLISVNHAKEILAEIESLEQWKREAVAVMPDFQVIGKLLSIPLGSKVSGQIIPKIKELKQENERLRNAIAKMTVLSHGGEKELENIKRIFAISLGEIDGTTQVDVVSGSGLRCNCENSSRLITYIDGKCICCTCRGEIPVQAPT